MALMRPRQTKFRKWKKYYIKSFEYKANKVRFGAYGMVALEGAHITAKQIEATRRILTRQLKRVGRVWIRIFPHIPVTSKPVEVRMGKGKGAVSHYIAPVKPGTIMFEIDGASDIISKEALLKAGKKLPIKVGFVDRSKVGDITMNQKFVKSLKGTGAARKLQQNNGKLGSQKRGFTSSSAAVVQQVFNRQHKMLQRDAAANARFDFNEEEDDGLLSDPPSAAEQRDFEYLRDEVADRLISRLDYVNRDFPNVLDVGSATGSIYRAFQANNMCNIKKITQSDMSLEMLRKGEIVHNNNSNNYDDMIETEFVQFDEEIKLPFEDNSFDLITSSLSLHWVNNLPGVMKEFNRCLKPDGAFIGAMLGGETLKELRSSLLLAEQEREGGVSSHVSPMAHVGDIGQLMQSAGFAIPTIDTDVLKIEYPNAFSLMEHLQGMGENNASISRRLNVSRDTFLAAAAAYQALYGDDEDVLDGGVPATFQIIYMIGWAPDPSQPQAKARGSAKLSLKDIDGAKAASVKGEEKEQNPMTTYTRTTLTKDDGDD